MKYVKPSQENNLYRPKRVLKVVARSESETESVEESMEIIKAPQ